MSSVDSLIVKEASSQTLRKQYQEPTFEELEEFSPSAKGSEGPDVSSNIPPS